jgi:hypothetical protein
MGSKPTLVSMVVGTDCGARPSATVANFVSCLQQKRASLQGGQREREHEWTMTKLKISLEYSPPNEGMTSSSMDHGGGGQPTLRAAAAL